MTTKKAAKTIFFCEGVHTLRFIGSHAKNDQETQ